MAKHSDFNTVKPKFKRRMSVELKLLYIILGLEALIIFILLQKLP